MLLSTADLAAIWIHSNKIRIYYFTIHWINIYQVIQRRCSSTTPLVTASSTVELRSIWLRFLISSPFLAVYQRKWTGEWITRQISFVRWNCPLKALMGSFIVAKIFLSSKELSELVVNEICLINSGRTKKFNLNPHVEKTYVWCSIIHICQWCYHCLLEISYTEYATFPRRWILNADC